MRSGNVWPTNQLYNNLSDSLIRQLRGTELVSEEEDERGDEDEVEERAEKKQQQQSLNKSRSMDFFKAKLLNIKNKAINNNSSSNYNINNHR